MSDSAYLKLRNDIIFGELAPNSRLPLEALRLRYGPSVPTLREVLSRLASEGFVDAEGQKGFRVAPVSVAGLREVAAMRRLIEADALRSSLAAGGIDWEATIIAAHHRLSRVEAQMQAGEGSDVRVWKQYDKEFHVALISACSSSFLLRVYEGVFSHYLRYQMLALGFRGAPARKEHQMLLELALDRDADAAVGVLAEHIDKGIEHAVASGRLSPEPGASAALR
jgi:DNA-binding GntR family transcriptional regulator